MDSDDDDLVLSPHAMAALQDFYKEQKQVQQQEALPQESDIKFQENWKLSQFWYSDETSEKISKEVLSVCPEGKIACLCTPTLFRHLHTHYPEHRDRIYLFDIDPRFNVYGDHFVVYDFNEPLKLVSKENLESFFDFIAIDPPYLNPTCYSEVLKTVAFMGKKKTGGELASSLLFLTGRIMREFLSTQFPQLEECKFSPQHTNNLGNDFGCFTTYHSVELNQ
eukprot:TRINITY_DN3365_c0_g1_i1.p1 TRINITY_DN3365_c0_g1~~TRINITY_DN3365_c0_g1_i1.p1  ORF type:complete len:222 (-),score=55.16 TRINITY_DN3365_c0_g1_i1:207-872(-)